MALAKQHMSDLIRTYFDGCNEADIKKMRQCFEPDAVHYFPPGMYMGPFRGAQTIAERWVAAVQTLGSVWTVDNIVADPDTGQAAIEWSHFKLYKNQLLRGDEWYRFDPESGLIREIRAYYAAPQPAEMERTELAGFDYAGRGYPMTSPIERALPTDPQP